MFPTISVLSMHLQCTVPLEIQEITKLYKLSEYTIWLYWVNIFPGIHFIMLFFTVIYYLLSVFWLRDHNQCLLKICYPGNLFLFMEKELLKGRSQVFSITQTFLNVSFKCIFNMFIKNISWSPKQYQIFYKLGLQNEWQLGRSAHIECHSQDSHPTVA